MTSLYSNLSSAWPPVSEETAARLKRLEELQQKRLESQKRLEEQRAASGSSGETASLSSRRRNISSAASRLNEGRNVRLRSYKERLGGSVSSGLGAQTENKDFGGARPKVVGSSSGLTFSNRSNTLGRDRNLSSTDTEDDDNQKTFNRSQSYTLLATENSQDTIQDTPEGSNETRVLDEEQKKDGNNQEKIQDESMEEENFEQFRDSLYGKSVGKPKQEFTSMFDSGYDSVPEHPRETNLFSGIDSSEPSFSLDSNEYSSSTFPRKSSYITDKIKPRRGLHSQLRDTMSSFDAYFDKVDNQKPDIRSRILGTETDTSLGYGTSFEPKSERSFRISRQSSLPVSTSYLSDSLSDNFPERGSNFPDSSLMGENISDSLQEKQSFISENLPEESSFIGENLPEESSFIGENLPEESSFIVENLPDSGSYVSEFNSEVPDLETTSQESSTLIGTETDSSADTTYFKMDTPKLSKSYQQNEFQSFDSFFDECDKVPDLRSKLFGNDTKDTSTRYSRSRRSDSQFDRRSSEPMRSEIDNMLKRNENSGSESQDAGSRMFTSVIHRTALPTNRSEPDDGSSSTFTARLFQNRQPSSRSSVSSGSYQSRVQDILSGGTNRFDSIFGYENDRRNRQENTSFLTSVGERNPQETTSFLTSDSEIDGGLFDREYENKREIEELNLDEVEVICNDTFMDVEDSPQVLISPEDNIDVGEDITKTGSKSEGDIDLNHADSLTENSENVDNVEKEEKVEQTKLSVDSKGGNSSSSQKGSVSPQKGSTSPQKGSTSPQKGSTSPQKGSPQKWSTSPQKGKNKKKVKGKQNKETTVKKEKGLSDGKKNDQSKENAKAKKVETVSKEKVETVSKEKVKTVSDEKVSQGYEKVESAESSPSKLKEFFTSLMSFGRDTSKPTSPSKEDGAGWEGTSVDGGQVTISAKENETSESNETLNSQGSSSTSTENFETASEATDNSDVCDSLQDETNKKVQENYLDNLEIKFPTIERKEAFVNECNGPLLRRKQAPETFLSSSVLLGHSDSDSSNIFDNNSLNLDLTRHEMNGEISSYRSGRKGSETPDTLIESSDADLSEREEKISQEIMTFNSEQAVDTSEFFTKIDGTLARTLGTQTDVRNIETLLTELVSTSAELAGEKCITVAEQIVLKQLCQKCKLVIVNNQLRSSTKSVTGTPFSRKQDQKPPTPRSNGKLGESNGVKTPLKSLKKAPSPKRSPKMSPSSSRSSSLTRKSPVSTPTKKLSPKSSPGQNRRGAVKGINEMLYDGQNSSRSTDSHLTGKNIKKDVRSESEIKRVAEQLYSAGTESFQNSKRKLPPALLPKPYVSTQHKMDRDGAMSPSYMAGTKSSFLRSNSMPEKKHLFEIDDTDAKSEKDSEISPRSDTDNKRPDKPESDVPSYMADTKSSRFRHSSSNEKKVLNGFDICISSSEKESSSLKTETEQTQMVKDSNVPSYMAETKSSRSRSNSLSENKLLNEYDEQKPDSGFSKKETDKKPKREKSETDLPSYMFGTKSSRSRSNSLSENKLLNESDEQKPEEDGGFSSQKETDKKPKRENSDTDLPSYMSGTKSSRSRSNSLSEKKNLSALVVKKMNGTPTKRRNSKQGKTDDDSIEHISAFEDNPFVMNDMKKRKSSKKEKGFNFGKNMKENGKSAIEEVFAKSQNVEKLKPVLLVEYPTPSVSKLETTFSDHVQTTNMPIEIPTETKSSVIETDIDDTATDRSHSLRSVSLSDRSSKSSLDSAQNPLETDIDSVLEINGMENGNDIDNKSDISETSSHLSFAEEACSGLASLEYINNNGDKVDSKGKKKYKKGSKSPSKSSKVDGKPPRSPREQENEISQEEATGVPIEKDEESGDEEVAPKRINLRDWDPHLLLKDLYRIKMVEDNVKDISDKYVNMEGLMEKLPMNKKKATLLKTWKRRFFKAKDGWLHYYETSNRDKPSDSIQLMGGRVDDLGNRILGIDDGRGRYLMVRCPTDNEYGQWKLAFETQTADNVKATYIRPQLTSPPNPNKKIIVIDLGSCAIRAGILGQEATLPEVFFPSVIAKERNTGKIVVGEDAYKPEIRHKSVIQKPVRPTDKTDKLSIDMEAIGEVFKVVFERLQVKDINQYWVMLSTPQTLGDKLKEGLMNILIDGFHAQGVCMVQQSLLALYSYNAVSGVIVDVGERMEILPIYDGYVIEGGVARQSYGGQKVADSLKSSLIENKYKFLTPVEQFIVKHIMEQSCYVTNNYKESLSHCEKDPDNYKATVYMNNYDLPEGAHLSVTHDLSCFKSPEGFFNSDMWGMDYPCVHKLVFQAIQSCPIDSRKHMYRSVYLSGGVTLLPGFAERLQAELTKMAPPAVVVEVQGSPQRYHAAFIGACAMSKMAPTEQTFISADEWKKLGHKAFKKWSISGS